MRPLHTDTNAVSTKDPIFYQFFKFWEQNVFSKKFGYHPQLDKVLSYLGQITSGEKVGAQN